MRQRQEIQALPREAELKQQLQTIAEEDGCIVILDQTQLPAKTAFLRLHDIEQVANAIRSMQVRGAPLIGATAAYGVAIGLAARTDDMHLHSLLATLAETRPTAVNLHWALSRMGQVLMPIPPARRVAAAWQVARAIALEDAAANAQIGRNGLSVLEDILAAKLRRQSPDGGHDPDGHIVQIMTHCNAGWLATVAHGTALAPIYAAQDAGLAVHVWVSETRPRNQGLLTAWELDQAGIAHTLIADNAAGLLLMQGKVDAVIVDRIAANGDTANKVGTYLKALAAKAHDVAFYVAAPMSTVDFDCPNGSAIPIEERTAGELGDGIRHAANPAFDITPAALIHGIITERGIFPAAELRT